MNLNTTSDNEIDKENENYSDNESVITISSDENSSNLRTVPDIDDLRYNDIETIDQLNELTSNLFLHQRICVAWMLKREKDFPAGGLLADDMGLGKTLTVLSLILVTRMDKNEDNGETLLLCPANLVTQWDDEIKRRINPNILSVLIYNGGPSIRETYQQKIKTNEKAPRNKGILRMKTNLYGITIVCR